jgi:type II secretory pathway component PulF
MSKKGMFSVREVGEAANAMSALLVSKADIEFAATRMSKVQPERAEFWMSVAKGVQNGKLLSEQLAGYWSADFLHPIKIGEKTSALPQILGKIRDASLYSEKVARILFKLVKPAAYIVLAVVIFLFYVGFVLPSLSSITGQAGTSIVGGSGDVVKELVLKLWPFCVAGLVGIGFAIFQWVKVPDNRLVILGWSLHVPYIGKGLGKILFAKWARYMALMKSTGKMDLWDMLRLTAPVLPVKLRGPLLSAAALLESGVPMAKVFSEESSIYRGFDKSLFPHEIVTAFIIAADTGNLHDQLDNAEMTLDTDGKIVLERGIDVVQDFVTVVASVALAVPMFLYFIQMFDNLGAAGRSL